MKVLFLTIYPFNNLTDRHFATDLIRKFKDKGHNVTAITTVGSPLEQTSLKQEYGVNVLRLKVGSIQKVGAVKKILNIFKLDRVCKKQIKKHFANEKFDLIVPIVSNQVFLKTVGYLKRKQQSKVYMLMKDMFPENAVDLGMLTKTGIKGLIYKFFAWREKKYYSYCDKIGAMTPLNSTFIKQHNPYLNDGIIEVNPNSITPEEHNLTAEQKQELLNKFGLPNDKKIVIYGGNLGEPQGVDFLVECIENNKREDIFYFIAGAGTRYNELEQRLNKYNYCKLVPMLNATEYANILQLSTVGLIFLDKRFTVPNCPSRVLSYLEANLPMIYCVGESCDMATIAEQNGFGFYVENGKLLDYENALNKILNDNNLHKTMCINAQKYLMENCTTEVSYNLIMRFCEE